MTPVAKPILCVGACAWTTIFRVAHLPRGSAKIMPDEAIQIGDGMSASAACAIVKLGGRAEFWARVGDDANGRAAIASLAEAGLDCSNPARFSVPSISSSKQLPPRMAAPLRSATVSLSRWHDRG